ncbi:hypothetical protein ACHAXA_002630 [Cyclostephanos tholiformis]|uniref:Uncharacterized protein n=1 Tax=Cyclostephanos tholiformis TaxID=382380 RepID=A0ABD3SCX1_9STRA
MNGLLDGIDVGSIDYGSLPEVPSFYPIERTSAVVDCSDPNEIATRIIRCMQKLSIIAPFNSEDASFYAEAVDHTKFYVRLYKSNFQRILVEFQRIGDGNSFNFVMYARAILAGLRSTRGECVDAWVTRSSFSYIPANMIPCHANKSHRHDDVCAEYMMPIEDMLKSYRSDAAALGIKSLLLLTDQDRSQVSFNVAEVVLHGRGHPAIKNFIHTCIHSPHTTLFDEKKDFDSRQNDTMCRNALAILGNSLRSASDAKCPLLASLVQSDEWMEKSGLVDALLYEISHSQDRCHEAYYAARCLNALLDSSLEMKRALVERGLTGVMQESRAVGRRSHSLLAQESDAALARMVDVSLQEEKQ